MKIRALTAPEVSFSVHVEQDDSPVRGNAMASGDDDFDREIENSILAALDNGDVWAWACVRVTATWNQYAASAFLGACSYRDESEFLACDYFAAMRDEALDALNAEVSRAALAFDLLEHPATL